VNINSTVFLINVRLTIFDCQCRTTFNTADTTKVKQSTTSIWSKQTACSLRQWVPNCPGEVNHG